MMTENRTQRTEDRGQRIFSMNLRKLLTQIQIGFIKT